MTELLTMVDVINVSGTSGITPQSIRLTGEIVNPGDYSIQPGETILDIINRAADIPMRRTSKELFF